MGEDRTEHTEHEVLQTFVTGLEVNRFVFPKPDVLQGVLII